jgi:NADH-quinone oxidoreductase subunit I
MTTSTEPGYFKQIADVGKTIAKGMGITLSYFRRKKETRITLQYPRESEKLPPRHRGIHFLETEKCIMCFICARACPVDCIDIEGSRDGSVPGSHVGDKAWLTRFTIDYGKCIFCNLCCEPCPKDCIHMGQEFDFSGYARGNLSKNLLTNRGFTQADLTYVKDARPQIDALAAEKARQKAEAAKKAAAEAAAKKAAAAAAAAAAPAGAAPAAGAAPTAAPAKPAAPAAAPANPAAAAPAKPSAAAPAAAKPAAAPSPAAAPKPAPPASEPAAAPPAAEEKKTE